MKSREEVLSTFRERVRERMQERGVGVNELAKAAKVHHSAISRALSTDREPKLYTAYAIAKGLKCSIDDLTG